MSTDGREPLADVVAELRHELGRIADEVPTPAHAAGLDDRVRRMAEATGITGDHPPEVRAGRLAPARRVVKMAIQRGARWYVERLALDARRFAEAATDVAAALAERVAQLEATRADDERTIAALRDRVGRLERRAPASGPAASPAPPAPPAAPAAGRPETGAPASGHAFDYYAFEALMRGSREEIRARQRPYADLFAEVDDILDVGCGRGEFLGVLGEHGKRARGIDIDADMVARCRAEGLEAERGDGVAHLAGLPRGSLGGVFAAQVVEHLRPEPLVAFIAAARAALRPGGVLVLETINPASLSALRNYFADLTHAQPLVPQTLAFLVESAGFRDVRIALASPLPDASRLARVPLGAAVPDEARAVLDRDIDLLNELLFAPQDYAVIARA